MNSCEQFRLWGTNYVTFQTGLIKDAEKSPGVSQKYCEIGERLFNVLELTRQDSLIQNFARNQADAGTTNAQIAEALKLMAEIASRQNATPLATAPDVQTMAPTISAEQAAFDQQPEPSVIANAIDVESAEGIAVSAPLAIKTCSDTTANGEDCHGPTAKTIKGKPYCRHHPKTD